MIWIIDEKYSIMGGRKYGEKDISYHKLLRF